MLVLSRREHEKVVIPLTAKTLLELVKLIPSGAEADDITALVQITVIVAEIRADKTRLGIEAPKVLPVHRQEVYEKICEGNSTELPEKGS
jgi:carbon storage regulator